MFLKQALKCLGAQLTQRGSNVCKVVVNGMLIAGLQRDKMLENCQDGIIYPLMLQVPQVESHCFLTVTVHHRCETS